MRLRNCRGRRIWLMKNPISTTVLGLHLTFCLLTATGNTPARRYGVGHPREPAAAGRAEGIHASACGLVARAAPGEEGQRQGRPRQTRQGRHRRRRRGRQRRCRQQQGWRRVRPGSAQGSSVAGISRPWGDPLHACRRAKMAGDANDRDEPARDATSGDNAAAGGRPGRGKASGGKASNA